MTVRDIPYANAGHPRRRHYIGPKHRTVSPPPVGHDLDPRHRLAACGCQCGSFMLAIAHAPYMSGDQIPRLGDLHRRLTAYLAAIADGETQLPPSSEPPNLAAFVASLSSAWRAGEIRPTFSIEAKPRYLRGLQKISTPTTIVSATSALEPRTLPSPTAISTKMQTRPEPVYAEPGQARIQALRTVCPIVCRRLEEFPTINALQLFEELCVQFPGRFTRKQYKTLVRRVGLWRQAARERAVVIGPKTYRRLSNKPRGRRPDVFRDHWDEMAQCLEDQPDQTALELLVEFQARYPGRYSFRQLHTLQKRVRAWRQQAVQRLIGDVNGLPSSLASDPSHLTSGNISDEASGNRIM